MTDAMAKTPWRIVGEEVGGCNCAWGCPCQFNALPTHGRCEGIMVCRIREGHFGGTRLDGVTVAGAYWWPGAIHEGNGIMRFAVDDKATPDQRAAILQIVSGKHGGAIFEIFASVVSTTLDPLFVPITLESDRDKRVAYLNVPGLCELRAEPIRNPVTGEEHRALIKLPNGFEYKEAEVGNTVHLRATVGDKTYENQNTYAQFAAVEWSNA
jgi:hypothetical protein